MTSLTEFWLPVLLLGSGLAIDLAITTFGRFYDRTITILNWAVPLALTHCLFPAASHWLFDHAESQLFLGVTGFVLISLVVSEITIEAIGGTPWISLSDLIGKLFNGNKLLGRRVAVILAVSWDALFCTVALTGYHWRVHEIILAFIIFGLIAFVVAVVAITITRRWRRNKFHDKDTLSQINYFGTLGQITILGSFAVSSLSFAATGSSNLLVSLAISTCFFALLLMLLSHKFWQEANKTAVESINTH